MATLVTGTSRNARHSSSSKLTTDICPGASTPAARSAAITPNSWLRLPTPHAVGRISAGPRRRICVIASQPPCSVIAACRVVTAIPLAAHSRRAALTRR